MIPEIVNTVILEKLLSCPLYFNDGMICNDSYAYTTEGKCILCGKDFNFYDDEISEEFYSRNYHACSREENFPPITLLNKTYFMNLDNLSSIIFYSYSRIADFELLKKYENLNQIEFETLIRIIAFN